MYSQNTELSCSLNVVLQVLVFAIGPGTSQQHLDMLAHAFSKLSKRHSISEELGQEFIVVPDIESEVVLSPREAFFAEKIL